MGERWEREGESQRLIIKTCKQSTDHCACVQSGFACESQDTYVKLWFTRPCSRVSVVRVSLLHSLRFSSFSALRLTYLPVYCPSPWSDTVHRNMAPIPRRAFIARIRFSSSVSSSRGVSPAGSKHSTQDVNGSLPLHRLLPFLSRASMRKDPWTPATHLTSPSPDTAVREGSVEAISTRQETCPARGEGPPLNPTTSLHTTSRRSPVIPVPTPLMNWRGRKYGRRYGRRGVESQNTCKRGHEGQRMISRVQLYTVGPIIFPQ